MGHRRTINLVTLPWPLNVLKFNQAVREMRPGDNVVAAIDDADVLGNLRRLLSNLPELSYDVVDSGAGYHIRVSRR